MFMLQKPRLIMQGNVIGVNTAIFTQSGTSAGVGFAIPIDAIRKAVPQLIEYGRIIRPTLNLTVCPFAAQSPQSCLPHPCQ